MLVGLARRWWGDRGVDRRAGVAGNAGAIDAVLLEAVEADHRAVRVCHVQDPSQTALPDGGVLDAEGIEVLGPGVGRLPIGDGETDRVETLAPDRGAGVFPEGDGKWRLHIG